MLQQLIHIILISLICIIWGLPAYIYLTKEGTEKYWLKTGSGCVLFLFFTGLLSLSLISSWMVLFIPLKFEYLLYSTIVLFAILLTFFKSNILSTSQLYKIGIKFSLPGLFFLITCILFITLGTLKPVNIDTQLYHLQIIQWNNEYGTVPGLANLYPRLGLGSNWFNLISIFYIPAFEHSNFTFLNTTITIWFLLWLLHKWQIFHNKKEIPGNNSFALFFFILIIYFLFDWQLFRDTANSTNYDFIVTALTIIVLTYFAEDIFIAKKNKFSLPIILTSLSIIPFKLSGIFILIPVFFYLLHFKSAKIWLSSIAAGLLILLPLLIRNYITTGYPLYPTAFSINSPDWQLPLSMTEKFNDYVLHVNKFYNQNMGFIFSYEKTNFNWIPFWFKGILIQHKILLILTFLSTGLLFYKPLTQNNKQKFRLFIISLWLMTAGWFFTAPDPRFAYGFLLFAAFLPLSVALGKFISHRLIYNAGFSLMIPVILIYGFKKAEPIIKNPDHFLVVIQNDAPAFSKKMINEAAYNKTETINDNWNNRCFFTPLPCLSEENPYLIRRGSSIKSGFRMNPVTDSNFIQRYNY